MTVAKPENSSLNAIVLAGGDGTRLTCLTRKITGLETPKTVLPNYWNGNALRPN